eukprot:8153279-Alexandrium_andersonii.AAC.1
MMMNYAAKCDVHCELRNFVSQHRELWPLPAGYAGDGEARGPPLGSGGVVPIRCWGALPCARPSCLG